MPKNYMKQAFLMLLLMLPAAARAQHEVELVFVRGGAFTMGDTCCYGNRKPLRTVTLSDFSIGKYEVTLAQFARFVRETSYLTDAERGEGSTILRGENDWQTVDSVTWRHDSRGERSGRADKPVIHVSWNDAVAFCEWLSRTTRRRYRLPTEAEWEYAAQGGQLGAKGGVRPFFSGSDSIEKVAWYLDNTHTEGGVEPVGQKLPNQLGVYDMTGNVWEWCADFYAKEYLPADTVNPQGAAQGERRVNRGGSWRTPAAPQSHLTHRSSLKPNKQGNLLGFRVVCTDCAEKADR
jgi:formylglycine-generating enzyme required for sulfatase activity